MACIVSIKKSSITESGRLAHEDIKEIWSEYDPSLHQWMLRLTEEFDLTFLVSDGNVSIVPCLLPDKEPEFVWPEMTASSKENKVKEFQVVYTFAYIPAGLFNRIQVRLYSYADSTIIWKNGSLLEKNKHLALLQQIKKKQTIQVKVHGTKPENIIFIIHEVF
jgi:leucine-rich repeat kinase 2